MRGEVNFQGGHGYLSAFENCYKLSQASEFRKSLPSYKEE